MFISDLPTSFLVCLSVCPVWMSWVPIGLLGHRRNLTGYFGFMQAVVLLRPSCDQSAAE